MEIEFSRIAKEAHAGTEEAKITLQEQKDYYQSKEMHGRVADIEQCAYRLGHVKDVELLTLYEYFLVGKADVYEKSYLLVCTDIQVNFLVCHPEHLRLIPMLVVNSRGNHHTSIEQTLGWIEAQGRLSVQRPDVDGPAQAVDMTSAEAIKLWHNALLQKFRINFLDMTPQIIDTGVMDRSLSFRGLNAVTPASNEARGMTT